MTWRPIEELSCPLRWRWILNGPFGTSSIVLDVNVSTALPGRDGLWNIGVQLFVNLWSFALAGDTVLTMFRQTGWVDPSMNKLEPTEAYAGLAAFTGAAANDTPTLVLMSRELERQGRTRVYLPGAPASWTDNGALNLNGEGRVQTVARAMYVALTPHLEGNHVKMLITRQRRSSILMGSPVLNEYTDVAGIRVVKRTTKAPLFNPSSF